MTLRWREIAAADVFLTVQPVKLERGCAEPCLTARQGKPTRRIVPIQDAVVSGPQRATEFAGIEPQRALRRDTDGRNAGDEEVVVCEGEVVCPEIIARIK